MNIEEEFKHADKVKVTDLNFDGRLRNRLKDVYFFMVEDGIFIHKNDEPLVKRFIFHGFLSVESKYISYHDDYVFYSHCSPSVRAYLNIKSENDDDKILGYFMIGGFSIIALLILFGV